MTFSRPKAVPSEIQRTLDALDRGARIVLRTKKSARDFLREVSTGAGEHKVACARPAVKTCPGVQHRRASIAPKTGA